MTKFSVRCTDTIHHTEKEKTQTLRDNLNDAYSCVVGFLVHFWRGKSKKISHKCVQRYY